MGAGELANKIGIISYMLPAVLLYRKKKTGNKMKVSFLIGTVFETVPPKVEYHLTELGESFQNIMISMGVWGRNYQELK